MSGTTQDWKYRGGLILLTALCAAPTVRAEPRLSPQEQQRVNEAIDRGVRYLLQTQGRTGTWATSKTHLVGYTALPALTLLECGAPSDDASVQRAAFVVRQNALTLDRTYELSLAILFLDRLGDPRDRPLIQVFALRLIAGQSPTGGWTYKCPVLTQKDQQDLLTTLRQLEPQRHFDPVFLADGKSLPDLVSTTKPGDQGLLVPSSDRSGLSGTERPGGQGHVSPGDSPGGSGGTIGQDSPGRDVGPELTPAQRANVPRPGWCIKMEGRPSSSDARAGKDEKDDKPKPARVVIPPRLRGLPVMLDPRQMVMRDPDNKLDTPIVGTTDNSNTQFATLALWAARRHDVPMKRTLNLLVLRFRTSQTATGGWDYRYHFGGGKGETPAMTCVGLLGLAVGAGIAEDGEKNDPKMAALRARDPRLVNGLVALTKHVGTPVGRMEQLGQPNLYFLWSVERVGVLFGLHKIGGKDWYRWAAECLVANQKRDGSWTNGGYPGAHAVLDTCLALLILKRANLASDLTDRLSEGSSVLTKVVEERVHVTPQKPPERSEPSTPPNVRTEPEKPPTTPGELNLTNPPPTTTPPTTTTTAPTDRSNFSSDADSEDSGGGGKKGLVIVVVILAVLALGAAIALLMVYLKQREQAPEPAPVRKKKRSTLRR